MNKLRNIVGATLLAYVLPLSGCTPHTTGDNEVGIRYCKFWCGDEKPEIILSGQTRFFMPLTNDWYTLKTDMQTFSMTADLTTGDRKEKDDLEFKTKEGNNIGQNVVLNWKIDPKEIDYIIRYVGTSMDDIKEKYVRPIARSVTRDYLNRLKSREFYEGKERFKAAQDATDELKKRFAPYRLIAEQLSAGKYKFGDDKFQTAINDAKNAGQSCDRYDKAIENERQNWLKQLETQKGISNQQIGAAEGNKRKIMLAADAYYTQKEQEALAIKAEKSAAAEAVVKLRQAMASEGGNTSIMMKYVEHFNPTRIVVLPCDSGEKGATFQKLDLNTLMAAEILGK